MEESILTAVQIGLLTTAVIGTIELIRRAFKRDWEAVVVIGASALVGGLLAGLLVGFATVVVLTGVVIGLGASGLITTVQKFGQGTPISETK